MSNSEAKGNEIAILTEMVNIMANDVICWQEQMADIFHGSEVYDKDWYISNIRQMAIDVVNDHKGAK